MATWTSASALSNFAAAYATDGSYIYKNDAGTVKQWDPDADSDTALTDGSSFPAGVSPDTDPGHLFYWNGGLYLCCDGTGAEDAAQVWVHTGGTTWSKVFSSDIASINGVLVTADYVILCLSQVTDGIYYTANGSTWSAGEIYDDNAPYSAESIICPDAYTTLAPATRIAINVIPDLRDVYFGAGSLLNIGSRPSGPEFLNQVGPDYYWFLSGLTPRYTASVSSLSFTTPANTSVFPVPSINMPYSAGTDGSSAWYFQGGAWVDQGSLADIDFFVRLADGTVFAVNYDGEIYASDEPIVADTNLTHSAGGIPGAILVS